MNDKSITCDDRQLLIILRSENQGAESDAVLGHVETCPHCQDRLERLAAKPEVWKKVGEFLSTDNSEDDSDFDPGAGSHGRFARGIDGAATWNEAIAKQMLSPPSHPEMLGRLGRYDVERMIGAGGMGVVFKAYDSDLNRPVAIKVLAPHLSGSGAARKRFAREARAAAAIVHEHVVPIHNVETEREAPFLVMQYIAGESLQSRIDRTGPLQTCEILRLGFQIASGLSAAHQQGLVHRDIKPANILVEQGVDRALISDFGLARSADDATLTRSGFHPGTPQFMSPEQASGEPVDHRSDLFSLGSVLYTICAGRPPFRAESSLSVLRRIADDEPRRIREINPGVPEWLCCLIGKLMAKQPSERFQSAAEVARLLGHCLAHHQQPDSNPLPPEVTRLLPKTPDCSLDLSPFPKVRTPMVRTIVGLASFLGLIAAFYWFQIRGNPELASLQGEWSLVASERDGKALSADEFFNERLVIRESRFTRLQTAPNGQEVHGESGRVAIARGEAESAIDFQMWQGTALGIYKLTGDELVLCVTREGGPRPDTFRTTAGDAKTLQTFRRKPTTANRDSVAPGSQPRQRADDRNPTVATEREGTVDRTAAASRQRDQELPQIATRPVMADTAPVIACLGPKSPVQLGQWVSHDEIRQGLDPEVVRLHVWNWTDSDMSRVLLIQRSELGTLSPDGSTMLTLAGETIDLNTKQTRQYSGFTVPDEQRITALRLSPTRRYAAAIIHRRTDVESLPTDPPTIDARHFWNLRLLQLDASTHTGRRLDEFPVDARPGIVFAADESSVVHSTEQHSIVRRELPSGQILRAYEPSLGVHGAVGIAISPEGKLIAAAGYHGTLYLWDANEGTLRFQRDAVRPDGAPDPFFQANVVRFSPNSRHLLLVSGNDIKIMDVATGKILREHQDPSHPRYVHAQWSADGGTITLLTSAQVSEKEASSQRVSSPSATDRVLERLPLVYEWNWEAGVPEVRGHAPMKRGASPTVEEPNREPARGESEAARP